MTTYDKKAEELAEEHSYCEDGWYSCPKSPEGCFDDRQGDECNCGREEKVKRIATALRTTAQETFDMLMESVPEHEYEIYADDDQRNIEDRNLNRVGRNSARQVFIDRARTMGLDVSKYIEG